MDASFCGAESQVSHYQDQIDEFGKKNLNPAEIRGDCFHDNGKLKDSTHPTSDYAINRRERETDERYHCVCR